jgi:excinuclease ABC subunit C
MQLRLNIPAQSLYLTSRNLKAGYSYCYNRLMDISDHLKAKLANLPDEPGVYFYKDGAGKIIYVGKAAVLKNRVRQYFQASRSRDPKTTLLVADIRDLEWITVGSEVEALFLESEFIKRYRPMYNIDLKDDKHWIYIKISKEEFPVVTYVRRPMDDGARYFGPFVSSDAVRRAMKYLRRIFPYVTHATWPKRGCLQSHLGLCPCPEEGKITKPDYAKSIRRLSMYLRGEQDKLFAQLEKDMHRSAKTKNYESAAHFRNQLQDLQSLGKQMIFSDKEAFDLSRDQALVGLSERLGLAGIPRRIEGYDISHMQGTDNVASMVVFSDGVSNRDEYRRFKMNLPGNDDFGHMREVMSRRFSGKNLEEWPKPDLLLIDGGKGQLAAALSVLDELGIAIPAIGLAKRLEEIIRRRDGQAISKGHYEDEAWITTNVDFEVILLPHSSHVLQLLQRVRDEAHRFAVTYHTILRAKRQTHSWLDDIPGVGPATRKLLIKQFGSVRGIRAAAPEELDAAVGAAKAAIIRQNF